jgi:NAD(P)-dependent dehydrogenase (short-subunit alcohol dehydrogenase family)
MSEDGIERDGMRRGDVVVITGAGGGFGRAFAKRLGGAGARIVAWDVNAASGEETVRQVVAAGGEARFSRVDLADAADIERAAQETLDTLGAPYCIINNASVFPRGEVVDLSLEAWELTFKVNITAPFYILKKFGPAMFAKKRGVVINLASGRAVEGAPKGANYACTKAAVISLTKSLALEWAKHNIRVNAIIPGQSLTAMPLEATPEAELHARAKTHNPLGRIGYPEDVAGLAAFLVSSDAAYMTGQGVAINGGAVMVP